jgi:hypothetical protein
VIPFALPKSIAKQATSVHQLRVAQGPSSVILTEPSLAEAILPVLSAVKMCEFFVAKSTK